MIQVKRYELRMVLVFYISQSVIMGSLRMFILYIYITHTFNKQAVYICGLDIL